MSFRNNETKTALNVERLARWLLGGLFVYASFHKIADPDQFARIINGYKLFPLMAIHPITVICPFFELVCGMALILGVYPRGAVLVINMMLLLFIVAISINLVRGHEFICGCFSFAHQTGRTAAILLLVRDTFSLVIGLYILLSRLLEPDRFVKHSS